MRYLRHCIWVLAGLLIVAALTVRLESVPPPWWDEGWTLSVARNWEEIGHYGRLLVGQPVPRGIDAAFHVTGAVALSFWLFGCRYCSGANGRSRYHDSDSGFNVPSGSAHLQSIHCFRLSVRDDAIARVYRPFSTLHRQTSFGRNACNVFSTCRLYSHAVSAAAPLMGAALAALFWAFALITKLQVLPFWTCSLMVPSLLALYRRDWKSLLSWVIAFLGSLAGSHILFCYRNTSYRPNPVWPNRSEVCMRSLR